MERSLEKEKVEVNKMAASMYSLWTAILAERERKSYSSTNLNMRVHQPREENGEPIDQMIDLRYDNSITEESKLTGREKSRQKSIRALKVYAVLLINGRKVSKTNKAGISWPNFNFHIKEMF